MQLEELITYRKKIRKEFHAKRGSVAAFAKDQECSGEWVRAVFAGEKEDYLLLTAAMTFIKIYVPKHEVELQKQRICFVQTAAKHYSMV
jgi:hypothetical protein